MRAFLHYVERLSKAKRRGTNPRKIAKLGRKVAKYSARAAVRGSDGVARASSACLVFWPV